MERCGRCSQEDCDPAFLQDDDPGVAEPLTDSDDGGEPPSEVGPDLEMVDDDVYMEEIERMHALSEVERAVMEHANQVEGFLSEYHVDKDGNCQYRGVASQTDDGEDPLPLC